MQNSVPHPLGLAVLITAAIALLTPNAIERSGSADSGGAIASQAFGKSAQGAGNRTSGNRTLVTEHFSNHAFNPSIATALGSGIGEAGLERDGLKQIQKQLQKRDRLKELPEHLSQDLPIDIRTARLMFSVESLFEATTAN